MKVLITGGAGFIGSRLALRLIDKGYEVRVIDNLSKQIHGEDPSISYTFCLIKDQVDFIKGDVLNRNDWKKALDGMDIVVHLAAETGTGQSMYEIEKYIDTNISGTGILLDELTNNKKLSVKKLLVASSRSVYGEGKYMCEIDGIVYPDSRTEEDMLSGDFAVKCPICTHDAMLIPTDESSRLRPGSVYAYTKKVQEELSLMVGRTIGLPVLAFRFQNVYGPGQSLHNPYTGILSIFSTQIKNNHDINVFEDGSESRDFVYIDDVVDALLLGIESSISNEVYNVGSNEQTDVLRVAKFLKEKYQSSIGIKVSGNFRLGDIRANLADLTKINADLGYEPKVDFKTGISNFIDWVEKQEVAQDNYHRSIEEIRKRGLYR